MIGDNVMISSSTLTAVEPLRKKERQGETQEP
jgi:hypothetical protein